MKIETDRLYLYPISDEEMGKLILQEENQELRQAYTEMLQGSQKDPKNRVWTAVWYMELKEFPGTIVGDFCFKGLNSDGMVDLGYGLREGHCKKGYMLEAVKAICEWALQQNGVTRIEAETDPDNAASQRVLYNAGFKPNGVCGEEGPRFLYQKM